MFSYEKVHPAQVYWKLKAWARDLLDEHHQCVICGGDDNLEAHHIIKCDSKNPMYFSPDNGVVICHSCHNMYHRKYREINPRTLVMFSQKYSIKLKKNNIKR